MKEAELCGGRVPIASAVGLCFSLMGVGGAVAGPLVEVTPELSLEVWEGGTYGRHSSRERSRLAHGAQIII